MTKTLCCEIIKFMKRIPVIAFLFITTVCSAQKDTTKWLRAFPITNYSIDLNDSTKVVQLQMPDGHLIKDKQIGVLYGVYKNSKDDAVEKGYGRCYLIKGDYHYFTIGNNKSGMPIEEGDLLYTPMSKTNIYYGQLPQISTHFIRLLNVYDEPFFDRYTIFLHWTPDDEKKVIDSLVADIKFTGGYFLNEAPSMNVLIKTGDYKGNKVLDVMTNCNSADVIAFLDYIIARPRLYAGKEWKVSEIFATWLSEGAPKVIK
jgi:hypothetical protein